MMIMIFRFLNQLPFVLFLFLFLFSFLNCLNESKEHDHLSDTRDLNNNKNSSLQNLIKMFHQNSKHYSSKDFKSINSKQSSKRILDQKINERNQLCSILKNEKCNQLPPECLNCDFNMTCVYGTRQETVCRPIKGFTCEVC